MMQAFQGSRILSYGDRNYNCMGDETVCTDTASGKRLWAIKIEGEPKEESGFRASPPAVAGGMLFITTQLGEVLQVDPNDGTIIKRYKVGAPVHYQPAVEGGKIYVGTENGRVVCIDAGDKKFTGWPCWGGNSGHTGVRLKDD
jgi:outer membrane protein assembly factor BamB